MQNAADPPRRVYGSEDADIVASPEELLGKSLNVPVHAPLVGPGIWRDETYAHERLRVDHRPAGETPLEGAPRASGLRADQPEHADYEGPDQTATNLDHGPLEGADFVPHVADVFPDFDDATV